LRLGWSSASARREADLFFADLVGTAAPRLAESVRAEAPSANPQNADLFWTDLLGLRPSWRRRPNVPRPSDESIDLRPPAESALAEEPESAIAEEPTVEGQEGDESDSSSIPAEAFGSDNVRISLRNDDGTPAAGIAFRARFRDGHTVNGTLDAQGEATIADHTHGDVRVTFPRLPAATWDISSFGGSGG
jgi:hypothetical protein